MAEIVTFSCSNMLDKRTDQEALEVAKYKLNNTEKHNINIDEE
jgi:hypothetical protein